MLTVCTYVVVNVDEGQHGAFHREADSLARSTDRYRDSSASTQIASYSCWLNSAYVIAIAQL